MKSAVRAGVVLCLLAWMLSSSPPVFAQCDPTRAQVPVSVTVGDGSTPTGPNYTLWSSCAGCSGYSAIIGTFPWGPAMATPYYFGEGAFKIFGDGPYQSPPGQGYYNCINEGGCKVCTGELDAKLYARLGSFHGTVTRIPEREPVADALVSANPYGSSTRTDENGTFDFTRNTSGLYAANNWALWLDGDGLSRLERTYTLSVSGGAPEDAVTATTYSSENIGVELYLKSRYAQNNPPEMRGCNAHPHSPNPNAGRPVNVLTGNVWFDQLDLDIPGTGGGLRFERSFNSMNANQRIGGAFGYGWIHSYERRLEFPSPRVVTRRRADGVPYYYVDDDEDGIYRASMPGTERSWIARTADGYTLHLLSGEEESYDEEGLLMTSRDAVGNEVTLERDGSGKLLRVVNGTLSLDLEYDFLSRITRIAGPAGIAVAYVYDGHGNLATVSHADGSGYAMTYDGWKVASVADATGRILERHTYDFNTGRGLTSELADGRESLAFTYSGSMTTVTDALGNVTTYEWTSIQGERHITRISGACPSCGGGGSETGEWAYDELGRITSYRDGLDAVTTFAYDAQGNPVTKTDPLGGISAYTYDTQGRVLTRTDPAGAVTMWSYGPAGPLSVTDALERTVSWTYDEHGRLQTVRDGKRKSTTYAYDADGRLISITDPLGNATAYGYDALGRRTSITDPLGNISTTEYDARGRVTRTISPDGSTVEFAHDLGGRLTEERDGLGRATVYGYDPYGRVTTVTDSLGGVTTYGYDIMSNLISLTDANGHRTTFEYDAFRRLNRVVYPNGTSEWFAYDAAGRMQTRTDRNGAVTTYNWDALGRLTGKFYSDGTPDVSYGYDTAGRLVSAANGDDSLSWGYDEAGQMLRESSAAHGSVVSYSYDAAGNRLGVFLDGTLHAWATYDGASRPTSVWSQSGLPARWKGFFFLYDAADRRTAVIYPGGAVKLHRYDSASRLTLSYSFDLRRWSPIAQSAYEYDAAGARTSKTTESYEESFGYDALSRLIGVSRDSATSEQYTYDGVGNRLSSLGDTTWTYNGQNQLLSRDGATYRYDANGNLLSRADGAGNWDFEWDGENRLRRVLREGMEVAHFRYDPLGRRIEKTAGGVTRKYVYDGAAIVQENVGASVLRYLHGPGIDEPLARWDQAGAVAYYHTDGLGSIVRMTDANGAVVETRQYDAWGSLQIGADAPGYAFTGREWDPETGLYYYRARYYDPAMGRFISEDPIGTAGGINLYAYVSNDPTNRIDPWGLRPDLTDDLTRGWYALKCGIKTYVCERRVARQCRDEFPPTTPSPGPMGAGDSNWKRRKDCENQKMSECTSRAVECTICVILKKDPDESAEPPAPEPCNSQTTPDWEHPWRYKWEEIRCWPSPPSPN